MRSGSPTEVPPNFWTIRLTIGGYRARSDRRKRDAPDRRAAVAVRYRSCVPNPRAQREQDRLQRLADAEAAHRAAKRKQIAVAVMCVVMIVGVIVAIVV